MCGGTTKTKNRGDNHARLFQRNNVLKLLLHHLNTLHVCPSQTKMEFRHQFLALSLQLSQCAQLCSLLTVTDYFSERKEHCVQLNPDLVKFR